MTTITKTINVCDRCGHQQDMGTYMAGNHWGQCSVGWLGDKGGRSWQGDAGGVNLKGKAWLCETCTDAFLEFMRPTSDAATPSDSGREV